MRGKRRRSLAIIPLSGVLLLAACSGSQPASDAGARPASGRPDVSAVLYGMDLAFPDGLDENHNPYLDYIEQATGLQVIPNP